MTAYGLVKLVHVGCVVCSVAGFVLQGIWMLRDSPWRRHPAVRWLPHGIDTVLLASALTLVVMSGQWPWRFDWLAVKLGLVLLYIVTGFLALSRWSERRWPKGLRGGLFLLALIMLAQIIGIALTRQPGGWIAAGA